MDAKNKRFENQTMILDRSDQPATTNNNVRSSSRTIGASTDRIDEQTAAESREQSCIHDDSSTTNAEQTNNRSIDATFHIDCISRSANIKPPIVRPPIMMPTINVETIRSTSAANDETRLIAEKELIWGALLGSGASGAVSRAKWKKSLFSSRDVAVKIVTTRDVNKIRNEVSMMHRLAHPNIIELFGFGIRSNFHHFIVMEYMDNGTLDNVLHDVPRISIQSIQLINWSVQLAEGLAFIHSHDIAHRDLKPSNILLKNKHQSLKIADFGTIREMNDIQLTTKVGTTIYMAPETFRTSNYTTKCDVYSFGITLCEMFTRQKPYAQEIRVDVNRNQAKFVNDISKIDKPLRPTLTADVPKTISTIIVRCWTTLNNQRPSMTETRQLLKRFERFNDNNEEIEERLNLLKMAIDTNRLTIDVCDKFTNEMDNLRRDEMREIGKLMINKLRDSQGDDAKIRCKQTLAFIDRLTICDDSIWMYYYVSIVSWCYEKLKDRLDSAEKKIIWIEATKRYVQMIDLRFWKEKNHPERIWILCDFAYLYYLYYASIDNESIDLMKKLIDEVKSMDRGMLSENKWNKSNALIELSEMNLEMCESRREWMQTERNEMMKTYCNIQMEMLESVICNGIKLSGKELRRIRESFWIQLGEYSNNESDRREKGLFCIEMLNRLDRIQLETDANWIYGYRWFIYHCYFVLAEITTTNSERCEIANRMQTKYRQLIEMTEEIFVTNNPIRIYIMVDFSVLCISQYRNEIGTECIQYLQSITTNAKAQSKGSLTDFEFERTQLWLERIENRLGTVRSSYADQ